jgi:hypothetical protein
LQLTVVINPVLKPMKQLVAHTRKDSSSGQADASGSESKTSHDGGDGNGDGNGNGHGGDAASAAVEEYQPVRLAAFQKPGYLQAEGDVAASRNRLSGERVAGQRADMLLCVCQMLCCTFGVKSLATTAYCVYFNCVLHVALALAWGARKQLQQYTKFELPASFAHGSLRQEGAAQEEEEPHRDNLQVCVRMVDWMLPHISGSMSPCADGAVPLQCSAVHECNISAHRLLLLPMFPPLQALLAPQG